MWVSFRTANTPFRFLPLEHKMATSCHPCSCRPTSQVTALTSHTTFHRARCTNVCLMLPVGVHTRGQCQMWRSSRHYIIIEKVISTIIRCEMLQHHTIRLRLTFFIRHTVASKCWVHSGNNTWAMQCPLRRIRCVAEEQHPCSREH